MNKMGLRAKSTLRIIVSAMLAIMLIFATASFAWAASEAPTASEASTAPTAPTPPNVSEENAGNLLGATENGTVASNSVKKVERDYCWAGRDISLSDLEVGHDVLIAGMNLALKEVNTGGSVRAAGMNLTLDQVAAGNNVTLAGKDIKLNDCKVAGGAYCTGDLISFAGESTGFFAAGNKVTINGAINGNAKVYAAEVIIGPNAVVTGNLHVEANSRPEIPETAQVGDFDYIASNASDNADEIAETAAAALLGLGIVAQVIGFIGTIVFALVLAWLFRRPVEKAASMTRERAGIIFGTGVIAAIAAPILFVLLLCFVVTIPLAIALLFGLLTLTIAAVPFAAASFARLVFPKMNLALAALIGGAALGLAAALPVIGMIVDLAAFVYTAGYVIQALWVSRRSDPTPEQPVVVEPIPVVETPAE